MAPINNKTPNNMTSKKQTGTVPKTTSNNGFLLSPATVAAAASTSRSKPTTTSARRAASSAGAVQSQSTGNVPASRKNTEIVAPTRRDLNDLNDYLFAAVNPESNSNSKLANIGNIGLNSNLDTTCFDLEQLQENQRFCFPVRPIPRQPHSRRDTNDLLNSNNNATSVSSTTQATVGVVIPTTPGNVLATASQDENSASHVTTSRNPSHNLLEEILANPQAILDLDSDLTLEQRLNFIQFYFSLTQKSANKNNSTMVNEKNNACEVVVNSASLEDVAHSEASDNRAQSITSIHSATEPTSPTSDDLQNRLESSNRNIQSIREQQQQLLRLQQTAKQHLADMENLRKSSAPLRCQNGSAPPDYESVEQVHSDMSGLVNRMKNLSTFIQGQHELSSMLGDDGPEMMAEQEALLRKLESLKAHREEMKSLVNELQNVNSSLERPEPKPEGAARVVPVEYQRVVPIELVGPAKEKSPQVVVHHETTEEEEDDEEPMDAATSDMIQQKMAHINTMKSQLQRLKDMMNTVKLIEERTDGKDVKDIGFETDEDEEPPAPPHRDVSVGKNTNTTVKPTAPAAPLATFEKDDIGAADSNEQNGDVDEDRTSELGQKVRLLNEVTADLREQAEHLASERNRIRTIKDEIKRRRANLEAAKSAGREKEAEKDLLRAEFELKKKEFEHLVQRLNSEETIVNEEDEHDGDDEEEDRPPTVTEQEKRPIAGYYSDPNWQNHRSCNSSVNAKDVAPPTPIRGKESTDSGAADVHGVNASLEAGSMQSGSSRSFSMPPPMRSINQPFDHFQVGPVPPPLPSAWNPYYFYSTPYSPHYPTASAGMPSNDFLCQFHNSGSTSGVTQAGNSTGLLATADPVLLQQFVQTQQMLINSVCQCNQLLWHQQREIDNLNSTVQMLTERLANASIPAEIQRAESVPPNTGAMPKMLFSSMNRAHSEQPQPAPAVPHFSQLNQNISPLRTFNTSCNYQQQQQSRRNFNLNTNAAFNFGSASEQQHQHHQQQQAVSESMYSHVHPIHPQMTYNNVVSSQSAVSSQQQQHNFLNNDSALNSANIQQSPIFMHHHNNTIGQPTNNNSNLLSAQQNCLANNSAVPNNNAAVSAAAAASALNNQVPPGNRANNYWDNFRSYSRQNLLSSNSCKSNEEQNQQHIQQQLQPHEMQTHHPQQQQELGSDLFAASTSSGYMQQQQNPTSSTMNNNLNRFRNEFNAIGQPQQPPPPQQTSHQRSQPILQNIPSSSFLNNFPSSNSALISSVFNTLENLANNTGGERPNLSTGAGSSSNLSGSFNWNSSNRSSVAGDLYCPPSSDFRNMNLNFGNNEQSKIPVKASCATVKAPRPGLTGATRLLTQQRPPQRMPPHSPHNPEQEQLMQSHRYSDMSMEGAAGAASGYADNEPSDEIKRNLLVNALKSDNKFTSKMYETLKEKIYRQAAYSLIQDKDIDRQLLLRFFQQSQAPISDQMRSSFIHAVEALGKPTSNEETATDDTAMSNQQSSYQNIDNLMETNYFNNNNNNATSALGTQQSKDTKMMAHKFVLGGSLSSSPVFASHSPGVKLVQSRDHDFGHDHYSQQPRIPPAALSSLAANRSIYCPDYDLINFIIAKIHQELKSTPVIDDVAMVRVAKLTASIVQNSSANTLGLKSIKTQSDGRTHISPKKIYAKIKRVDCPKDRENFLIWYRSYLQQLFVIRLKRDDEDVNLNLDRQPSRESINSNQPSVWATDRRPTAANASGPMSLHDVQRFYRHIYQAQKSNIPFAYATAATENKIENNHDGNIGENGNNMKFDFGFPGNAMATSNNNGGTPTTPGNNIMNEDLAEADQICSSRAAEPLCDSGNSNSHSESFSSSEGAQGRGSFDENLPSGTERKISLETGTDKERGHGLVFGVNFPKVNETENNENPEEEMDDKVGESTHAVDSVNGEQQDNAEDDTQLLIPLEIGESSTAPLASPLAFPKRNSAP